MTDDMTLYIDPETRDLEFDGSGIMRTIRGADVVVQNVRHSLLVWKGELSFDEEHGTDYERLFGLNENDIEEDEVEEIVRDAVLQEDEVSTVENMEVSYEKRTLSVSLEMQLEGGESMTLEVANG